MSNRIPTILAALAITWFVAPTTDLAAQVRPDATRTAESGGPTDTDIQRYERLIAKLRGLDAQYQRAIAAAKDEMRARNGEISHTTATRIDTLRDEIDLTQTQLVAIAAVTGRPVPSLESLRSGEATGSSTEADAQSREPTVVDSALRRAKRTVLTDLESEARQIVRRVRMPIIGRNSR
jgi:hypothetical protein